MKLWTCRVDEVTTTVGGIESRCPSSYYDSTPKQCVPLLSRMRREYRTFRIAEVIPRNRKDSVHSIRTLAPLRFLPGD